MMTLNCIRQDRISIVGGSVGTYSNDLHLYYKLLLIVTLWTTREANVVWGLAWSPFETEKESRDRSLCICMVQQNRWSISHPYAWGRRLSAYHLDPCYGTVTLDSVKENGTSVSCGVKALSWSCKTSIPDCGGILLCSLTPAWYKAIHVSKWWMKGRRHKKMSQRNLCISGRCLGKELPKREEERIKKLTGIICLWNDKVRWNNNC